MLGAQALDEQTLPRAKVRRLCLLAAAAGGVVEGHLAIEIVDAERIARLNAEHRGKAGPTDVLSFPIDGTGPVVDVGPAAGGSVDVSECEGGPIDVGLAEGGPVDVSQCEGDSVDARPAGIDPVRCAPAVAHVPRELGDVVICPEHTEDLCEAVVHGVLHLVGMDHETDAGEMLALQAELLRWESPADASAPSA